MKSNENDTKEGIKIPSSALSTRIALLALLALKPMHGYELRQVMEQRHMHRWADVRYGSIYSGLQQLAREGFVEAAGEYREGNRPPRTIYKINDAGLPELKALLRQAWTQPALTSEPVDIALSFFMFLPVAEIVGLLEQRLVQLDAIQAFIEEAVQRFDEHIGRIERGEVAPPSLPQGFGRPKPRRIRAMMADQHDHRRRLLTAEREWTTHLLERFKSGAYDEDDDAWCEPGAHEDVLTAQDQPPHIEIRVRQKRIQRGGHRGEGRRPHRRKSSADDVI